MTGHQIKAGEQLGFMVTSGNERNGGVPEFKERSNVVVVSAPADSVDPATCGGGGGGAVIQSSGGTGAVGGGGSMRPTVIPYMNGTMKGYEILNFSQYNSESVIINGIIFQIEVNFITPTTAGVSVNSQSYTLSPNTPVAVLSTWNYTYYIDLESIHYTPILHTISILMYMKPNPPLSTSTTTTTSTSTLFTTKTTTKTTSTTTTANQGINVSSSGPLIGVGVAIVIAIAAGVAYFRYAGSRRREEDEE